MYTLTKLGKVTDLISENPLRTESITGLLLTNFPPKIGEYVFIVNDKPIVKEGNNARQVNTSKVVQILEQDSWKCKFQTENSIYLLEKVTV